MTRAGTWTGKDEEYLIGYYPTKNEDWSGWATLVPHHTYQAIKQKACQMGVRKAPGAVVRRKKMTPAQQVNACLWRVARDNDLTEIELRKEVAREWIRNQ